MRRNRLDISEKVYHKRDWLYIKDLPLQRDWSLMPNWQYAQLVTYMDTEHLGVDIIGEMSSDQWMRIKEVENRLERSLGCIDASMKDLSENLRVEEKKVVKSLQEEVESLKKFLHKEVNKLRDIVEKRNEDVENAIQAKDEEWRRTNRESILILSQSIFEREIKSFVSERGDKMLEELKLFSQQEKGKITEQTCSSAETKEISGFKKPLLLTGSFDESSSDVHPMD